MIARVLRLNGSAEKIDEGVENYKSRVVPALREQNGYRGARLLTDPETGAGMSITFWDDEEACRASFEALAPVRADAASRFGGQEPDAKVYEAAVQHRPQPTEAGHWVRLTTMAGDPAKIDDGIRHFESRLIPDVSKLQGFRAAILLVDRASGNAMAATVWNSKGDLDGSAGQAGSIRSAASETVGAGAVQVESFEVAFAELLTPAAT